MCNCIDSIDLYDRENEVILNEVSDCIDKQVVNFQLISKLTSVTENNIDPDTGEKQPINIEIGFIKDSEEYKGAYSHLERILLSDCESIKQVFVSNNKHQTGSVSSDPESRRYYELGYEEAKDGN